MTKNGYERVFQVNYVAQVLILKLEIRDAPF